jgi:alcohol dehydrogenase class IV
MQFEFWAPGRLVFGEGAFERVGEKVAEFGEKVMVVTGRRAMRETGQLDRALGLLEQAGVAAIVYSEVPANPTLEAAQLGAELARSERCDVVLGLGGGSAMDAAKAIAIGATHKQPIRDFMVAKEGKPRQPTDATLPVLCATSTAGTASELTPFSVLTITDIFQKSAIRSPHIQPRVAIEDPELTYSASPEITASTGIDVMCHALESYISNAATPITDLMSQEAIRLVGLFLPRAYRDGQDIVARRQMMLANAYAGYGLACCGTTIMHGMEHPVSAYHPAVAHGTGLAALIPAWVQTVGPRMPERIARVAELLGRDTTGLGPEQAAAEARTALTELLQTVGLSVRLRDLGVQEDQFSQMAQDTCRYMGATVTKTPGEPSCEQITELLRAAY